MGASAWSRRRFLQVSAGLVALQTPMGTQAYGKQGHDVGKLLKGGHPLTWVFAGDSVTQGALHTYGHRSYSELFAEHVRWVMKRYDDVVINAGVNGTTAAYLNDRFNWFVSRFQPTVVFLMYGINDCIAGKPTIEAFGENLRTLIEKVRQIGGLPILQTPNGIDVEGMKRMNTASRAMLPRYVEMIQDISKRESVVMIDHYGHWKKSMDEALYGWLDDPLHPSAAGHSQLANLILKELHMAGSIHIG